MTNDKSSEVLQSILKEMAAQQELYRPGPFWQAAINELCDDLIAYGIDQFRSMPSAVSFFAPTYGRPGVNFSPSQTTHMRELLAGLFPQESKQALAVEEFLSGSAQALADYRVFLAASPSSGQLDLSHFSESSYGAPTEQHIFDGRSYSRSSLNYLLGLSFLKRYIGDAPIHRVMEIGGGFGSLGEILLTAQSGVKQYINLDIAPTLYFAHKYLERALGVERVECLWKASTQAIDIATLKEATIAAPWLIEQLKGSIDLFVNFISFQEMEPHIVANYLRHVERFRPRWVLLRNIREGKQRRTPLNPVGVDTPIKTDDYEPMLSNYRLVARSTMPFGYKTADGYHSELSLFERC